VSSLYYDRLALEWSPQKDLDKQFLFITIVVVLTMVIIGVYLSSIPVPETQRTTRNVIPERIANFILEKKKTEPKVEKPKPKPIEKPKPKPKAKVKKQQPKKKSDKPLTETQKKAREIAAESGLLALSDELSDLMDTSDITEMVGGKVISNILGASQAATPDTDLLVAKASQGSGGVNASEYTTTIGKTVLLSREITQVTQPLAKVEETPRVQAKNKTRTADARREEDPGLKGKIILQITIAPDGKVIKIKVVSSELNDPKLESGLLSRIKLFDFGARNVEQVTVTYPIEFLPS
jgi:TonB family protein